MALSCCLKACGVGGNRKGKKKKEKKSTLSKCRIGSVVTLYFSNILACTWYFVSRTRSWHCVVAAPILLVSGQRYRAGSMHAVRLLRRSLQRTEP